MIKPDLTANSEAQASAPLVRLSLRRGEALAESRQIEGAVVYFCAKDHCPHYQGQLGLLPGTASMYCALVLYPPDRTCQPFYLEAAEDLDHAHRQTWQERLAEAEAFDKSLSSSSPLSRSVGGDGRGGQGVKGSAPPSSVPATILPFRPPSPAPRGRAGEGAPTQRRTTR